AALCAAALIAQGVPAAENPASEKIERQRDLFRAAYKDAELGIRESTTILSDADRALLTTYVLWPDLQAAYLRATIRQAGTEEIERYLDLYGALKPGRELRYQYALDLAARGDLESFYAIYESFYQGLGIAKLDCLALQAEIEAGRDKRIASRARALWMLGQSQANECDPVFAYLKKNQVLGPLDYRQRYALAIEARSYALARWLGKSIDATHVEIANLWLQAQNEPAVFLASYASRPDSAVAAAQLAYAAERLTYDDPIAAHDLWATVQGNRSFTEEQSLQTARHIALWSARDNLPGAYALLARLPAQAVDDEVSRWRARLSLRAGDWQRLLADIERLTDAEQQREEWRYWHAMARQQLGELARAELELASLAKERSYYGFLAADELGLPYAFQHSELQADEVLIEGIATRPALIRARELFYTGLEGRGRSEWDAVVRELTPGEKLQAAILAGRWGWYSRAIATAADIGAYDDLELRYPLAFKDSFEHYASIADIPLTWAYGIARSESLFMRDIRSSAGAIGVMQLMPATGRDVAQEMQVPFAGIDTLTNPVLNIQLGTAYLGKMAERFAGNRVLATAAYNAGPHRVDQWIPLKGPVDARVWIENIPFNETRMYVRRVVAAETIFHWRLTGETRRVSDELAAIEPLPNVQRLASVSR
ncbi:MAG TPA: transglycosylase SLT domain-containing protein, partial [Woeseiaceae bacterium]|nr:transglycosylase SLT domain-containing protein [Woeseiaceae bacterium]